MVIQFVEENLVKGVEFLVENGKKDGVVIIEFGLQYEVMVVGEGVSLVVIDMVKVYYKGMLLDGIEFDFFYFCGEFVVFLLNCVIFGWMEGV